MVQLFVFVFSSWNCLLFRDPVPQVVGFPFALLSASMVAKVFLILSMFAIELSPCFFDSWLKIVGRCSLCFLKVSVSGMLFRVTCASRLLAGHILIKPFGFFMPVFIKGGVKV